MRSASTLACVIAISAAGCVSSPPAELGALESAPINPLPPASEMGTSEREMKGAPLDEPTSIHFPHQSALESRHLRHILIPSEQAADAILDRLASGADFAQLARKYSLDVGTKQLGGDLGWTVPNGLEIEFARASWGIGKRGDYAKCRTRHGWHVVQFLDSKPAPGATTPSERLEKMQTPVRVPSDPSARYFILERGGTSERPTITTKRINRHGETSYSIREYDCRAFTVRYLRDGDSWQEMLGSRPDPRMAPIVRESIAYYLGLAACDCLDHPNAR